MSRVGICEKQPAPWLYLFGVTAWTWTLLGAVALTGRGLFEFPNIALGLLGLLGPLIVSGVLVAAGYRDPALDTGMLAFFRRSFDPRTLAARWWAIVLGLVGIVALAPVVLDGPTLREHGLFQPGPPLFLAIGFLAGVVEEPGWRGYALEGLQRRMPVLAASLVVGVFWAAWHLPLFVIPGTYQAGLGLGTAAFWAFCFAIIAGSPLYAWLYNVSGRAVFAVVLYHGVGNLARELVPDAADVFEVGVELALTLVVVLACWRWLFRPRPPS